jgi:hypothetical protein
MIRNPLLSTVLVGLLELTAINVVMGLWSHRLPYVLKLESIRNAHEPNVVFIGNSLLDGHLDEPAFVSAASSRGDQLRPLNAALGASLAPEQQLLFQYTTETHRSVHMLVVGVYDFQLTANDRSTIGDLTGNRMVGLDPRFPPGEVATVYGFDFVGRIEVALFQHLPLIANRANIWKYVELLRRSMASMGMPRAATNTMGRVDDFAALEAASSRAFVEQADAFLQHPNHFNSSYESIFRQARQGDLHAVIVMMPMSPYHRQVFYSQPAWHEYMKALAALANQRGIDFLDASDWVQSEQDFADHLHMSPRGCQSFSVHLGEAIAKPSTEMPAVPRSRIEPRSE